MRILPHGRLLSLAIATVVFLATNSFVSATNADKSNKSNINQKIVVGVDGGTESIRACCFDATTGARLGTSCAVPYPTYHPQPGWAEQDPHDWYENLGTAVRGAVASLPRSWRQRIAGICLDTTCCSVLALDANHEPLGRSLLWMDARSAPQTQEILAKARGNPALRVNSNGQGPLSAEWMTPKALWISQERPEIWERAETICEYQDYLNFQLTGNLVASSCNAASRWHWDGNDCLQEATRKNPHPGRPLSLYQKLGIPELAQKLPQRCLPMGALVGHLTDQAAKHLQLPQGLPVAQGGADAFVGMIGLGCIHPGQLCLITGSSHLHCVVSSKATTAAGTWGAYQGAPLPGINFAEGGQSSTGSIVRWMRNILGASKLSYQQLDDEAAAIPPGCEGLVALETFQGSRTPVTDPLARGALMGLTLSHTRAHLWRAVLESVCFGTRACVEGLTRAGHGCDEIVMAGGSTRSDLWLQMHADVTGKPVVVCENSDAPLLGCAILASVNAGVHATVEDAVKAMVRTEKRIESNPEMVETYTKLHEKVYSGVGDAARPIVHAMSALRGGGREEPKNALVIISPSLLACDWTDMRGEVQRCLKANANRLHVDIFDGVAIDSPHAFTFGPKMVAGIRTIGGGDASLDLHMCVDRPARYVQAMAEAGADCFIFQWEAMDSLDEAKMLVQAIVDAGMDAGVSINPNTHVNEIEALLLQAPVSVVDVLAVEAGFGGQTFQPQTPSKVQELWTFRQEHSNLSFSIMVDGGINEATVQDVAADIVVAGTYLFQHFESLGQGVQTLENAACAEIEEKKITSKNGNEMHPTR